jgi:integrase
MTTSLKSEIAAAMYRSGLSTSTGVAYTSLLHSLGKQLQITDIEEFRTKKEEIVPHVRATRRSPQTRKSVWSGLLKLTGDRSYLDLIKQESRLVDEEYAKKEVKDGRPTVSMVELERVVQHYRQLFAVNPNSEFHLQTYLIASVTSGVYFPVRRSLDWIEMRMDETESGNYVDWEAKEFVYRVYKNSTKKGTQTTPIPAHVFSLLKKLRKVRPSGLMFLKTSNNSPYSSSEWTKKLNALYGDVLGVRGIGTDVLRSSTATHHGALMATRLERLARLMGTSVDMLSKVYIKDV